MITIHGLGLELRFIPFLILLRSPDVLTKPVLVAVFHGFLDLYFLSFLVLLTAHHFMRFIDQRSIVGATYKYYLSLIKRRKNNFGRKLVTYIFSRQLVYRSNPCPLRSSNPEFPSINLTVQQLCGRPVNKDW